MFKGLMMNPFIQKALDHVHRFPTASAQLKNPLPEPENLEWSLKRHPKTGGLIVDDRFRVKVVPRESLDSDSQSSEEAIMRDVFALGDVAVMEKGMLPATAQVANQEAKWLGKRFNKGDLEDKSFTFKNMGVMTYLGNWRAIMQTDGRNEIKGYFLIPTSVWDMC
jgi:hypothetical protein